MSSFALLGSLATAVSTISILPHLIHALRNRRPAGAAFPWAFGAFSSGLWFVYGIVIGDFWVAAPGLVTIPVGVWLSVWCVLHTRKAAPSTPPPIPVTTMRANVPEDWAVQSGDTLELPRIAV